MDANERTDAAIAVTRNILRWTLTDSKAIIMLTDSSVTHEDIQNEIYTILAYLEKTAPDKSKETEE